MKRDTKIYHTLQMRLVRAGFCKNGAYSQYNFAGSLANYLTFLFKNKKGIVFKSDLICFGLMKETDTYINDLLISLVKTNFIVWEPNNKDKKRFYQTFVGYSCADLLNKNLLNTEQIATQKELLEFEYNIYDRINLQEKRILDLEKEVYLLNSIVAELIEIIDPPLTDEKLAKYKKSIHKKQNQ